MAPVPTMVESYARCLEVSTRSLFCGHRRYVDANHIPVSEVKESPRKMLELPDIETTNEKMKKGMAMFLIGGCQCIVNQTT